MEKYLSNRISPDEFREFWQLLEEEGAYDALSPELQAIWQQHPEYALSDSDWDQKLKAFKAAQLPPPKKLTLWRYVAAASVILVLASYWLLTRNTAEPVSQNLAHRVAKDVVPGHNGAVLTLSNGKKVILDSAGNGQVIQDANLGIVKKDGEIVYTGKTNEIVYNTVSTDKGRQWRLTLPDGTKVWLNSVSSIHYPLSFTGSERLVEVTGEAYFEVVHNARQPFKVKVGDKLIEDIGTSFNVNAYSDEADMRTTLLEGSVSILSSVRKSTPVILKPGQQAQINHMGQISVNSEADIDEVMSWKNGWFNFNEASTESIMRQIGRWYDLDVQYAGRIQKETFSGIVSRSSNLSQVLKIMEQASIKFRIEGKTIVVMQ